MGRRTDTWVDDGVDDGCMDPGWADDDGWVNLANEFMGVRAVRWERMGHGMGGRTSGCDCPREWKTQREDVGRPWPALSPQLPIVASSIVSLYFLELTDLFKPAKVGFQCYDRTLSMPYVETSEELIPLLMLLSLAFAAPAASVSPRA